MNYDETKQDKPTKITTWNIISIMCVTLIPWFIGMFEIFDRIFRWSN